MEMMMDAYGIAVAVVVMYAMAGWLVTLGVKINYGRLKNSLTKFQLNPKLGWFLFEVPNLFWAVYFLFYHRDSLTLAFFLFIIHYINRDIIYPLRLKTSTKVPIDIVIPAFSFTTANGYLQAQANHNSNGDQIFVLQCLGVGLFFLGMWINIKSDSILQKAKQRSSQAKKNDQKTTGQVRKYVRIDEFLFCYVANPNYLGEVIEWFGYFLVSQSFQSFLFAFSTLNILTAGAIPRNKWNKENIPDYPQERKAIIPFVI